MSELYALLNATPNMIKKGLEMASKVESWMIKESNASIAIIIPRKEDSKTFRVSRVMLETGEFECSCERWALFEKTNPPKSVCSHLIAFLETLKSIKGEEYANATIFKIVAFIESKGELH